MVSLRCHKEPDLRADQHNTGKAVYDRVGLQCINLYYVTGMHTRHSELSDLHTPDVIWDTSVVEFRSANFFHCGCVYMATTWMWLDIRSSFGMG
jgi:hypothetical protein